MMKCKKRSGYWPLFLIKFVFFLAIAPTVGFAYHYVYKFDFHSDLHDTRANDLLSYEKEAREAEAEENDSHFPSLSLAFEKCNSELPFINGSQLCNPVSRGLNSNSNLDLNQGPSPPINRCII